jgi:DNA-binding NarL/FixJ family response regulator
LDNKVPGARSTKHTSRAAATAVIRLAIVDDHQLMTQALSLVLEQEEDLRLVGSATTCAEALEVVPRVQPDVLLLDVSLPDGNGLACVPELQTRAPGMQILVLTSMADARTLLQAVELGVSGFVGKQRPVADVLKAIRQASAGEVVMPTDLLVGLLTQRLASRPRPTAPAHNSEALTPRELEVLACAAEGLSTDQIAEQLSLSTLTVRTHLRNAMGKLHAHSRLEAVAIALRQGLISPPQMH